MKVVLLLCLCAAGFVWANEEIIQKLEQTVKNPRVFESIVKTQIENIRKQLIAGDPAKGVPSLDPLELKKARLHPKETEDLKLDLNVTGSLVGALHFSIDKLKITFAKPAGSGFVMKATVSIPKIKLAVDKYGLALSMKRMLSVDGAGTITLDIENLEINCEFTVGSVKDKGIFFKAIGNIEMMVTKFLLQITGFEHDEDLSEMISQTVTNNMPQILTEMKPEVNQTVAELLFKALDGVYIPIKL